MVDIWQQFLTIAKEEVGSRVVETWFKAVVLQRWDASAKSVYLQVPNQFVKDWIKSNYLSLIQTHLKRLLALDDIAVCLVDPPSSDPEAQLIIKEKSRIPDIVHDRTESEMIKPARSAMTAVKKTSHSRKAYHFDTFVVGSNNKLAYAAAKAVAEKPGNVYNPLFIYGNSGLGKTHLLHAIMQEIKAQHSHLQVIYQSADKFVHEYIHAIRFDKMYAFTQKYKSADVLLVDDIQCISKKEQTQEAFFHIFNTLYDAEKQIVFTSDTFPQDIQGITDRLKYRLAWGLVVDMHVPCYETKIAIIKKKAELHHEQLPDEVADYIAGRMVVNVRELEGLLIRVLAFASLTGQPITVALAEKVLSHQTHQSDAIQPVNFDRVVKCIGKHYPYTLADLRSKKRNKEISFVRQVAMFLMKRTTDKSLRDIGLFLGGRDHSTVMYAVDKVEEILGQDTFFSQKLKQIEDDITGSH